MRITEPPPFSTTEITTSVWETLMDIEGIPILFISLLHVPSREAIKDSSLSTSTILKALHARITVPNIHPSWVVSDDADLSKIWRYAVTTYLALRKARRVEWKIPLRFLNWNVMGRWCCVVCHTMSQAQAMTASPSRLSFSRAFSRGEQLNIILTEDYGPLYA
ncbi:uncharacterized protein BT62DRAFT_543733 [Guyanagaster necrorhizus]|uniref:Uncharacterized protein n=1 Tax=Guyanagaster necrorhizus TaxID=856835 RepID=A0A9P8AYG8_9AGAR|nr:uncharacterized protein BT62DRAFT_543733 [Guyanagaster necrorhizus MCA 3950]KAG7450907.1 hypothetical protein BT62DRAFT_543733 [Guyanagaster necrorhizus MCA 3950]